MVYKVTILCFLNLTAKIYRYACRFMSYFYLHPIHCVLFLFTPKCNEFKMMNSSLFFKNHFRFVCICLLLCITDLSPKKNTELRVEYTKHFHL